MSQQWPPVPAVETHATAPQGSMPQYSMHPVAVRRTDPAASLFLLLAGVAAGVSLLLGWLPHNDLTGLDLVRRGTSQLVHSVGRLPSTGLWQPLAIVVGGGLLFLLGLLMLVPARSHRFFGLLALLVTAGAGAGALVPLSRAGWRMSQFGLGFWLACAVAVLGLLGALKALLTGRRYANPYSATTAP